MKTLYTLFFILFVALLSSCEKEKRWDDRLNGVWVESYTNNVKSLPSSCTVAFKEGEMMICNSSLTKDLGKKSEIYAENGKIWIRYQLPLRTHTEFRYNYAFDGTYLWLKEETSSKNFNIINTPGAKKYRKQ